MHVKILYVLYVHNSVHGADDTCTELLKTVIAMASRGLRTLCLAYADVSAEALGPLSGLEGGPPQLPLTACCMLGIKVGFSFLCPKLRALLLYLLILLLLH